MISLRKKMIKQGLIGLLTLVMTFGLILFIKPAPRANASIQMNPAYDLSEWQHQFTDAQVQSLKNEASFVILRAQYGSQYHDKTFQHNLALVQKYHIPYGVYSYSMYDSSSDAKGEAQALYNLAPDAGFYVNDIEQNNVTSGSLNDATAAWANQMRTLTDRPIVLYSGLNFMTQNIGAAKTSYDALWLAAYSSYEPNPSYHYDLWQYTDKHYSAALGQSIDASVIPTGGKPLSFWTGSTTIAANNSNSDSSASSSSSDSTTSSSSSASSSSASSSSSSNSSSSSSSSSSSVTAVSSSSSSSSKSDSGYNSKSTVKVIKTKINPIYYSYAKITKLRVTNRKGINLYDRYGDKVRHYKKGQVIKIKGFRQHGNMTQAMVSGDKHFTSNKKFVKWVR